MIVERYDFLLEKRTQLKQAFKTIYGLENLKTVVRVLFFLLKVIYSEKATKFCEL